MDVATKAVTLWDWGRGRQAHTLLYHSISNDPTDQIAVSPAMFRTQMAWLAHSSLKVITTSQLIEAVQHKRNLTNCVVITFDDAYGDFLEIAAPILSEYQLPATVFVPTGLLGKKTDNGYFKIVRAVMNWEQLAKVCELGYELGSHTISHPTLTSLNDEQLGSELIDSLAALRQFSPQPQFTLAYPFGQAGKREQVAARLAGYSGAYLAGGLWGNGKSSNLFTLTRCMVANRTSLTDFKQLLSRRNDLKQLATDLQQRRLRLLKH